MESEKNICKAKNFSEISDIEKKILEFLEN